MPPVALWLAGRAHYREFMERVFAMRGPGWRLLPVGQRESRPGRLRSGPGHRRRAAHSLQVFDVSDGLIRRCVTFADPAALDLFAPPTS